MCFYGFVFCRQKTAYELRVSDWSSDVCSSDLALRQWGQSTNKVRLIRNGIDVGRYGVRPKQGIISGLNRSPGKLLVGTLAGLRPVKNLRRLVRAVASHDDKLQLVIVGEGPERGAIRAEAARSEEHTSELQSLMRNSYA